MLRHQAAPPAIRDALDGWQVAQTKPICLAPGAPTGCSGKVVDCHVVQRRGSGLQMIARNGKVYGFKFHPMFFIKKQGRHAPELVGIGTAGTFPLFCSHHDRELFRQAETKRFVPTARQLLELNYRTVACRVHTNQATVPQISQLYDADGGMSRDEQRRHFIAVEALRQEAELYLENIRTLKQHYDAWLVADHGDINALVLRFLGRPELMCASIVYAIMDFRGHAIPPIGGNAHLCFYTVADANAVTFVYSWIGSNVGAERLCSSLLSLPEDARASALVHYALEYIDNSYFQPEWWENLSPDVQESLIARLTAHAKPFREHTSDALVTNAARASNLRSAGYEVVGRWQPNIE